MKQQKCYEKVIDSWLKQIQHFPVKTIVITLRQAMQTIWFRANNSINDISLSLIFERALLNNQNQFTLLSLLFVNIFGVGFDKLLLNPESFSALEYIYAFRHFYIDIFRIIDTLTSGILIDPLCNALLKITPPMQPQALPDSQKEFYQASLPRSTVHQSGIHEGIISPRFFTDKQATH